MKEFCHLHHMANQCPHIRKRGNGSPVKGANNLSRATPHLSLHFVQKLLNAFQGLPDFFCINKPITTTRSVNCQ